MNERLNITDEQLAGFCQRWSIAELWLFGSVLRDDFNANSDVDVMIGLQPNARFSTFDHAIARQELADLLGRRVDLFTKRSVEANPKRTIRREILDTAQRVYAA